MDFLFDRGLEFAVQLRAIEEEREYLHRGPHRTFWHGHITKRVIVPLIHDSRPDSPIEL